MTQTSMTTLRDEHSRDAVYFGDRPDWLIAYAQHRDSDTITRTNWAAFIDALGGESDTVAIERSSHWAVGWVEYLVINPDDTEKVKIAEELRERIETYPVLDEFALSALEHEEYQDSWRDYGASDFVRSLVKEFGLSDAARELLDDCDGDALQEFYESNIPSGEFYTPEGSGVRLNIDYAVRHCTREAMAAFLKQLRS